MRTLPSRRSALAGSLAALLLAGTARGETRPRQRVILDNDFSGDPDGLFQLAHHLLSPSVEIPFIVGSHIHVHDFLDGSTTQADNAVERVQALMATLPGTRRPDVIAGRNSAPEPGTAPEATPAARRIVAEAMRDDTKLPLFYCAGAGLTELAQALRLEPRISDRLTLAWIGGMEYRDLLSGVPERHDREYNLTIDLAAAQTVFNDARVPIWQVPRNVYRQMIVSDAELKTRLKPTGALGDFLLAQVSRVKSLLPTLGETYILGDSPLVTLTALQTPFEPDSASSAYVERPTPRLDADGRYQNNPSGRPMRVYTTIDTRLTFDDMFAKFAAASA
ncbi:nucleoside hydrolase [Asticcacaulis solisilvae]|uniref:nucleoside hydrolase n=1 Tax=Asticcacaulis solisilvae TaxID=1217274 RepID=UPI003FD739E9